MSNAPHFDIDVPSFWADPYPALAKMRKEAPIAFVPQLGSTVFTRRDDIFTQEKRIDVFSSHQPAGLIAAPLLAALAGAPLPHPTMPGSLVVIAIAGLLVGFGSRMGGGCTSGHGVCGVARLSARSIVATAVFMAVAIITVAVLRHGIGG